MTPSKKGKNGKDKLIKSSTTIEVSNLLCGDVILFPLSNVEAEVDAIYVHRTSDFESYSIDVLFNTLEDGSTSGTRLTGYAPDDLITIVQWKTEKEIAMEQHSRQDSFLRGLFKWKLGTKNAEMHNESSKPR